MSVFNKIKSLLTTGTGHLWQNDTFSLFFYKDKTDYGTFEEYANQGILNPYVYLVTKKIADLFIDLPFVNMNNNKIVDDINYTLFYYPNKNQTQADFLRQLAINMLVSGNAFIRKTKAGQKVVALDVINTNEIDIITDANCNIIRYEKKTPSGMVERIEIDDIWHIRYDNITGTFKDKLYGLSPLKAGWQFVQSSNHILQTERLIYENRAINTILTNDSDKVLLPKDKEALDEMFNDDLRGSHKAGKVKVTSAKLRAIDISMTPQQLQMLQSDTKKLRQICGLYGVPSFIFGDTEKSSYNNMSEAYVSLYRDSVLPFGYFILAELTELFKTEMRAKTELSINESDIDSLNIINKDLSDITLAKYDSGLISLNEARVILGLPEVETKASSGTLNGAQVTSLIEVLAAVGAGTMPTESARAVINAAFPTIPQEYINQIIDGYRGFAPPKI